MKVMLLILILLPLSVFAETPIKPIKSYNGKFVYLYSAKNPANVEKIKVAKLGRAEDMVVYGESKKGYIDIKHDGQLYYMNKSFVNFHNWYSKPKIQADGCLAVNEGKDMTHGGVMGICSK